jgi:hypothetical protein
MVERAQYEAEQARVRYSAAVCEGRLLSKTEFWNRRNRVAGRLDFVTGVIPDRRLIVPGLGGICHELASNDYRNELATHQPSKRVLIRKGCVPNASASPPPAVQATASVEPCPRIRALSAASFAIWRGLLSCSGARLRIQSFTVTAFNSVNASTPSCPSSRPQPDSLKPPNGRLGLKTLKQFTQTAPAFNACAKRNALETSRVQMLAAKP